MSISIFSETIILLDTEYTAWEGSMERNWRGRNEHREIVQIAAIKVNTKTLEEIDTFSLLIKPTINPKLSSYFTNLTGISQKQIEETGIGYRESFEQYSAWSHNLDTYSFGRDEKILRENCKLKGVVFSLQSRFFDARDVFKGYGIPAENYNSGNIVEAFGKKKVRRQHDALNDVRTILDGLRLLEDNN